MEKKSIDIFICDFCGLMSEDESFIKIHEQCCAKNPINQPCSTCCNMIVGVGCSKGVNPDSVGGNVLCFCYQSGEPINPMNSFVDMFDNDSPPSN